MLDEKLLEVLVCPKCKGGLEYQREEERLICWSCALRFQIKEDIPILLLDEAEKAQLSIPKRDIDKSKEVR